MKLKLLWLVFAFVLAATAQAESLDSSTPFFQDLKPTQQQSQAANLAGELLTRYHYKAMPLDDVMSEKIYDHYLKALDSEKIFFVQTDIDQLAGFRTQLDDAILKKDLTAPFAIFNLYARRVAERFAYARYLLKDGFDFQQKENYQYEREKEPWPKSEMEIRDVWRKRVKNDWLRLKLAGKADKYVVETLDKRYENSQKRVSQFKSDDAFQTFMNAYTMAIEPHTNYMGPRAAEEFDIAMKLSLVGIGAVLAEKDDYTIIRELVPGGPAALSNQLKIGDRILGVAQGEGGLMTDIMGSRLDDTVALIRGAANSIVLLDVLPAGASPDGKHRLVSIIRKKITLKEQSAKKSVLSVKDGNVTRHIGVITLPGFYEDSKARLQGDAHYKSASRDVLHLLDKLKREKVDGVLVDLRNNGGGSLAEAIELTGLFIGKGPVVQTRDARGQVVVEENNRAGVAWNGPLGVLINRNSASASEIFAAAIQDYGRGLVIGEPSFGKGTVQSMIDLDQIAKNDKPQFGEIKLTVAQFFRVNGGTTQLRGVTPDISFPVVTDTEDFGESSFDNALPWTQVKSANFTPVGDLKSQESTLLARHEARAKTVKDLLCLEEGIAYFKHQTEKHMVSLYEGDRIKERDDQEARQTSCETGMDAGNNAQVKVVGNKLARGNNKSLRDDGLQADERNLATELAAEKATKNAKDVLLNEAVYILSDEVGLLKPSVRIAASIRPGSPLRPN